MTVTKLRATRFTTAGVALESSMSEVDETSNQQREEQIDAVGWVFAVIVVIITALAAIIAYNGNDTTMVVSTPVSHVAAR